MAEKAVTPEKFVVDHSAFIPDGLESVVYEKEPEFPDTNDYGSDEGYTDEGGTGGGVSPNGIPIPNNLTVVSQTIRRNANGQEVVDLVVDVTVPGVSEFELHVTKA